MRDREPYASETADRFMVRLPDMMRQQIKDAAKANKRTMNAEIVARLERTFIDEERGGVPRGIRRAKEGVVPKAGDDNPLLAQILDEHEDRFDALGLSVVELETRFAELKERLDKIEGVEH